MSLWTNWRRGRRWSRAMAAGVMALALAGCSDLVDFDVRDEVPPDALNNAAGAQALFVGALRSFGRAFAGDGGGTEGQALISGMMADEWLHSGTFNTRVDYDKRAVQLDNGTLDFVYRLLQVPRLDAIRAIDAMIVAGANPASDDRIGAMYNRIAGVFMYGAMNYCNGIAFSSLDPAGNPIFGAQITNVQAMDSADVYFDKALASAAGTGSVNHNTARLLKARVLMLRGTGQFAAAAALAGQVLTTFRASNEHSTINGGTENGIFVFNNNSERWTLAHLDGINGLPFRGAGAGTNPALADPRVPWKRDGTDVGFDNTTPQYDLQIYKARDATSFWAKGEEARLIEAEAALQAGNVATWLAKLNELRAATAGLAPLVDPGTTTGRVNLLFSERAFWLFANGTRLSDLRRMIRQYGRVQDQIFPTGTYPRPNQPGVYGPDVNFPVPNLENANPDIGQTQVLCLDRNA